MCLIVFQNVCVLIMFNSMYMFFKGSLVIYHRKFGNFILLDIFLNLVGAVTKLSGFSYTVSL